MAERRFTGRPASPGLAIGPLIPLDNDHPTENTRKGSPSEERAALDQAIAKALADLEALAAVASGDGAEILAFQIEMLADPALIEDALPRIEEGEGAVQAWRTGLGTQIAVYQTADDDYFRARASDFEDLRDRVARILEGTSITLPDLPNDALVLDRDLAPSQFIALAAKGLAGIALVGGSASSHVAILARGRGLPMIVGLGPTVEKAITGDGPIDAILDADAGDLLLTPSPASLERCRKKLSAAKAAAERAASTRHGPAFTADGERIDVMLNVDDPRALDNETLAAADGVGLLRSEFLLIGRSDLPDEDEHFRSYADLQRRLAGKPLVIRTLDIGGDKPLAGLDLPKEQNPFLGLRGIRLCLERPALFMPQIRALLRTAAGGPLQVMLPMVTAWAEIEEAQKLFVSALRDLKSAGIAAAMPPLGIMVETPAAALAVDSLGAEFYSIGSNDLIQYVMAAARDSGGRVASLLDPGHPAIERLIADVVAKGRASAKEVSLCGDMASDPAWLPLLLRTGLRKISVAPAALDRVK
ncbi:MAG: phosphoenolpyruvate--protein phosphotransferase, partial [Geminicoccaceae bacterium]